MLWRAVALVFCAAVTVSACGGEGDPSAVDAATESTAPETSEPTAEPTPESPTPDPSGPACSDVWVAGQDLPRRYAGCSEDGEFVQADVIRCASGQMLVSYGDRFYAALGNVVNETDVALSESDAYADAVRVCG